jgi:hypothetical protein
MLQGDRSEAEIFEGDREKRKLRVDDVQGEMEYCLSRLREVSERLKIKENKMEMDEEFGRLKGVKEELESYLRDICERLDRLRIRAHFGYDKSE